MPPRPAVDTARVERETRRFIDRVVIALGLCPFAQEPFRSGRVDVCVTDARDEATLLADLDAEMTRLVATDVDALETTLLVHPRVLGDFDAYNAFLDLAEGLLVERGYEGVLQIASFHPHYRFAGVPADDPANATNRSPWPMLHLLREASVSAAVALHPDAEAIPARNVERLRSLGPAAVRTLLDGLHDPD